MFEDDWMEEDFPEGRGKLNIVICINQKPGTGYRSPINEMLEQLQYRLKEECSRFQQIRIAYVYETSSLDVRPFTVLDRDTPVFYKDYCEAAQVNDLAHLWFMGLALLEQKQWEEEKAEEQRLYLVTDEKFARVQVNEIVREEDGRLQLHPRFRDVEFTPFLFKAESEEEKAGGDLLEEYILQRNKDGVEIFTKA